MDRRAELLKHVTKEKEGIEIGPFCNPLVPRREGFNSIRLDVFTQDELRRLAINDPGIDSAQAANIESVDLLGPTFKLIMLDLQYLSLPPLSAMSY